VTIVRSASPEELANLFWSISEAFEDLPFYLVGGLAAQEFYSRRRVREVSDIDILTRSREDAEEFLRRMKSHGWDVFYNESLDKYTTFKHNIGIYIDVYPGKIGKYPIEKIERFVEIYDMVIVSPEDLIGIKLYSYLDADRGNNKHIIDVYTILIGKVEIDLDYLLNRVIPTVSEITDLSIKEIIETMCNPSESILSKFRFKERRFIELECKRILYHYRKKV